MQKREYLDLPTEKGTKFYLRKEPLKPIYAELEEFFTTNHNMGDLHFAKKMLFSHEIKANNQVEGYGDDLSVIESVIEKKTDRIKDEMVRKRIYNLYRGYQYILRHHILRHRKVDEEHLCELYKILSKDLLEAADLSRMGEYYRTAPVYILKNGRLDMELDEGVKAENIEKLLKYYFDFFNNADFPKTMTDEYIKSQILHFYFVYIHPYFDGNGRTSRTMSLWHLLKTDSYPYIIFNRGIGFAGFVYDNLIREAKSSHDITYFLRFMLERVKLELEKESVMQAIANNTTYKLSGIDYQTMLYFLSMHGTKTIGDFIHFYNSFNDKKKVTEIYDEMIQPLISADILKVVGLSKKMLANGLPNMFLEFNKDLLPSNEELNLKRLRITQSSKK